jgi:hypothetical protein
MKEQAGLRNSERLRRGLGPEVEIGGQERRRAFLRRQQFGGGVEE